MLAVFEFVAITNPAISDNLGGGLDPGGSTATIIVMVWQTLMTLGGLATLIFLILGGLSWLTAGEDKTKVEGARSKITNAVIGMGILFVIFAFVNFLGPAIGIDLLKLSFPTPDDF